MKIFSSISIKILMLCSAMILIEGAISYGEDSETYVPPAVKSRYNKPVGLMCPYCGAKTAIKQASIIISPDQVIKCSECGEKTPAHLMQKRYQEYLKERLEEMKQKQLAMEAARQQQQQMQQQQQAR